MVPVLKQSVDLDAGQEAGRGSRRDTPAQDGLDKRAARADDDQTARRSAQAVAVEAQARVGEEVARPRTGAFELTGDPRKPVFEQLRPASEEGVGMSGLGCAWPVPGGGRKLIRFDDDDLVEGTAQGVRREQAGEACTDHDGSITRRGDEVRHGWHGEADSARGRSQAPCCHVTLR